MELYDDRIRRHHLTHIVGEPFDTGDGLYILPYAFCTRILQYTVDVILLPCLPAPYEVLSVFAR
jgi:hypothetical protein